MTNAFMTRVASSRWKKEREAEDEGREPRTGTTTSWELSWTGSRKRKGKRRKLAQNCMKRRTRLPRKYVSLAVGYTGSKICMVAN